MELYTHPSGAQEKEKILLLHGLGGTGALWRPIASTLEEEYSLLAPDQRGHGKSQTLTPPGASYTPVDYGQDLVETLEKLNFYPTWVIGHSMGVRSACALAYLRGDWIRGLILVDLSLWPQSERNAERKLVTFLTKLPMQFASRQDAKNYLITHSPDPSIAKYLLAVSITVASGTVASGTDPKTTYITFPFDQSSLIKTLESAHKHAIPKWIETLAQNGTPILILRGAMSHIFLQEDFMKEKKHFSHLTSIKFEEIQDTGHGLPFEKRIEFVERVKKFIKLKK